VFRNKGFLRIGVVSTSPNPQAGGPPCVGCPQLLIQYICSYPPNWRPFLHPQSEDAPCHVLHLQCHNIALYMCNCIRLCILLPLNVYDNGHLRAETYQFQWIDYWGPTRISGLVGLIYRISSHTHPGLVLNLFFMPFWFKHLWPIYTMSHFAYSQLHMLKLNITSFISVLISVGQWQCSTNTCKVYEPLSLVRSPLICTNYLLTPWGRVSPSSEANLFSASQEIPRILWNVKVHYHIHRCLPPVNLHQLHSLFWAHHSWGIKQGLGIVTCNGEDLVVIGLVHVFLAVFLTALHFRVAYCSTFRAGTPSTHVPYVAECPWEGLVWMDCRVWRWGNNLPCGMYYCKFLHFFPVWEEH